MVYKLSQNLEVMYHAHQQYPQQSDTHD